MTALPINGEWIFDHDIPLPRKKSDGRKIGKHPVDRMKVGDSLFFPEAPPGVSARFYELGRRRPGWKFATRSVVEDGVAGARVWRIT
jgi:hypothetical protein